MDVTTKIIWTEVPCGYGRIYFETYSMYSCNNHQDIDILIFYYRFSPRSGVNVKKKVNEM